METWALQYDLLNVRYQSVVRCHKTCRGRLGVKGVIAGQLQSVNGVAMSLISRAATSVVGAADLLRYQLIRTPQTRPLQQLNANYYNLLTTIPQCSNIYLTTTHTNRT